jgi:hypothetical protein
VHHQDSSKMEVIKGRDVYSGVILESQYSAASIALKGMCSARGRDLMVPDVHIGGQGGMQLQELIQRQLVWYFLLLK